MRKLEYKQAIYYKGDVKCYIKPEDLIDKNILYTAKTEFLMDDSESVRLRPRLPENKKPHFYAPDKSQVRTVIMNESDPLHNKRLDEILSKLKLKTKWKVMVGVFIDNKLEREPKFILEDYLWGGEINRITSSTTIVRHDIFGKTKKLSMSIFEPCVAIEVINTHYPSKQTFNEMINASKNFPYIIIFDLIKTKKKNYFLKINENNNEITPLYYIYNGVVWKGGTELGGIIDSTMLEIELKNAMK
ncbi:hypothetical protein CD201_03830 [Hafnia alvei]|uniref:hypothetical protein n=1 Tax=Hafnia alvei TaxID=569 RepID=UPI000DAAF154|nr:hypothetical protein [Hafnia alvei]AWV43778.1 hypothetical protein CD201_03830 [Hafnia alvei]